MPEYHRCRAPFAAPANGTVQVIFAGTIVTADDWRYRASPGSFVPLADTVETATAAPGERRADVETATQAPGERRNVRPGPPKGRNRTMPHRSSLPPEHPDSPASVEAPMQPAAGYVAPDVPDEQNPAGGPKGGEGGNTMPGTADLQPTGKGPLAAQPATSVSESDEGVDAEKVMTAIENAVDPDPEDTKVEGTKATAADSRSEGKSSGKSSSK
jgi:hypothetical protein